MHRYPELFFNSTRRGITPKQVFSWNGTTFPTFGTHWNSTDARWIISGEWLYLNHNDWNSANVYLNNGNFFIPDGKFSIENYVRNDGGSDAWDFIGYIIDGNMNGRQEYCYFNGAGTNAHFFNVAFSYRGSRGVDIKVYAEIQNGLQQLWINDNLMATLNLYGIFPIIKLCYGAKQYVKIGRIKINSERNW